MSLEHRQYLQRAKSSGGGLPRRSGGLPYQPKLKNTFDLGVKASAFSNTPALPHEREKEKEQQAVVKEVKKPTTHKEEGLPQKEGLENDGGLPVKGGMKKAVADIKILPKGGLPEKGGLIQSQKGKKHRKQVLDNVDFFEERELVNEKGRIDNEKKSIAYIENRNLEIEEKLDLGEDVKFLKIEDVSKQIESREERKKKLKKNKGDIKAKIQNGTATKKDIAKVARLSVSKKKNKGIASFASIKNGLTDKNEKNKTKLIPTINTPKLNSSTNNISALSPITRITTPKNSSPTVIHSGNIDFLLNNSYVTDVENQDDEKVESKSITRTQKGKDNVNELVRLYNLEDNDDKKVKFLKDCNINELMAMAGKMNITLGQPRRRESYVKTILQHTDTLNALNTKLPVRKKSKKKSQAQGIAQALG